MKKIYLSPSSQTANRYACDNNISEAQVCREIAGMIYEMWLADDEVLNKISMYMPPHDYTVSNRIAASNDLNVDYHICIHTNAGGGKGLTIFGYYDTPAHQIMAKHIELVNITKTRGVKINQKLAEVKKTTGVCIYCELEFHDNVDLSRHIIANKKNYANAIYQAIKEICNVGQIEVETPPEETADDPKIPAPDGGILYRVQVGAFKNKENADRILRQLESQGYPAYIKRY